MLLCMYKLQSPGTLTNICQRVCTNNKPPELILTPNYRTAAAVNIRIFSENLPMHATRQTDPEHFIPLPL
jgi:hypothetical protein